ncbi:Sulfate permease [Croceitalea dokdonensis DOKDO 023]|uniref:Sulfate permease n=1 Tax=Croceitalea dokdonensis DOKDO 023 TaxID=1300341 RepID=A0A0P7AHJ0_9FLAO|nr:SulP family inorganic anion transporter [Croceitalea dokdonensis]KPM33038.1 Sulfate permease [Croceitalea dokdonensis DOKDO 023]
MSQFFRHFRGDLFGGITAGIVALPLALAFGVSSGLGPSAGLYGAIFISIFAALFGGTPTQISGPTAPMTAVSMVVIATILALHDGDVQKALPYILGVFLLAGLMQIGLGILKLGVYIKYIPYPVVSGFMTAIGIIILVTQLLPAVGYYPKEDAAFVQQFMLEAEEIILENILREEAGEGILVIEDFEETLKRAHDITAADKLKEAEALAAKQASGVLGTLKVLPKALGQIIWLELALALATILIIYGFKKITTAIPGSLAALILVSGMAYLFGLDYRTIEKIPEGLPVFQSTIFTAFDVNELMPYLFTAFTLAVLGAIDSLLTSVVADNMTRTKHQPNKELIGQGIGNSIAALFGGIPGAGATIRTVVNIKSGGKTRLSGIVAGILLLMVLLALGPIASQIPAAVLAGILITVGINVMDYRGLKAIPFLPRDTKIGPFSISSEVVIMLVVVTLASFWNLVYAVGIGLIIACIMFMKIIGELTTRRSAVKVLDDKSWMLNTPFPVALKHKVFVKHLKGPLFFGSTNEFQKLTEQLPNSASVLIIRLGQMQYMDQSGLYAMEEVLLQLKTQKITVLLVNVLEQPKYMMAKARIIPKTIPESHIFPNFSSCLFWMGKNLTSENP